MDKTEEKNKVVFVTGATGRLGRLLVDELLRTGVHVRALTRRPEQAAFPSSVEVMAGDLTIPASIEPALEGASAVFLLWTTAGATAPEVIARLAVYLSSKPRRVVYLSSPHQTPHPFFQQPNPMRELHIEIERLLAATNLEVVVLRPGMFASNVRHWWAAQIRDSNVVRWPYAAAETAPIDERDITAVAARVLIDEQYTKGDFVLTGLESLSQATQVEMIGNVIGRPLRLEELSPDEFRRFTAGTWPEGIVNMLLNAWQATLGHSAFVSSAVQDILGVPPRTFYKWASDHASAFMDTASDPTKPQKNES